MRDIPAYEESESEYRFYRLQYALSRSFALNQKKGFRTTVRRDRGFLMRSRENPGSNRMRSMRRHSWERAKTVHAPSPAFLSSTSRSLRARLPGVRGFCIKITPESNMP